MRQVQEVLEVEVARDLDEDFFREKFEKVYSVGSHRKSSKMSKNVKKDVETMSTGVITRAECKAAGSLIISLFIFWIVI